MAKKLKRELDCLLSPEDKAKLAIKASEDRHRARELKEQANSLDKAAKESEDQVAKGIAKRQVECVEDKDFARNAILVTRMDDPKYWPDGTALVETRAMQGDERQTMIDGVEGDDDEPPKVKTKAPKGRGKNSAN